MYPRIFSIRVSIFCVNIGKQWKLSYFLPTAYPAVLMAYKLP
jgi:hypothetical protein